MSFTEVRYSSCGDSEFDGLTRTKGTSTALLLDGGFGAARLRRLFFLSLFSIGDGFESMSIQLLGDSRIDMSGVELAFFMLRHDTGNIFMFGKFSRNFLSSLVLRLRGSRWLFFIREE